MRKVSTLPISKEENWRILDLLIDPLCPLSLKKVRDRSEKRNEPETHETLSLYLEEYKVESRAFKEKLTL